jgi:hypothetical protein
MITGAIFWTFPKFSSARAIMQKKRHVRFDQPYHESNDPSNHSPSLYERAKYGATLARLRRPYYASVVEVGCSVGVLSARLRLRCDRFLGLDLSA